MATGISYDGEEQELIKKLVQARVKNGGGLEHEDLDDYELPPRSQFSMIKKPAVTIRYRQLTFNMACIRLFEGVEHVLLLVNRKKKRLAVIPCSEEESESVVWAHRKASDGEWTNNVITSLEFVEKLYALNDWSRDGRWKALGHVADSDSGLILVFDLQEAVMLDPVDSEYTDPETGETKKRRKVYYPERYKDCIGKSYSDYVSSRQMSLFEYLDEYTGNTYGGDGGPPGESSPYKAPGESP